MIARIAPIRLDLGAGAPSYTGWYVVLGIAVLLGFFYLVKLFLAKFNKSVKNVECPYGA